MVHKTQLSPKFSLQGHLNGDIHSEFRHYLMLYGRDIMVSLIKETD